MRNPGGLTVPSSRIRFQGVLYICIVKLFSGICYSHLSTARHFPVGLFILVALISYCFHCERGEAFSYAAGKACGQDFALHPPTSPR